FLPYFSDKIQIINCKLEHMYGYGDDENKFVGFLLKQMENNENEIQLTKGEQKRDFIYIEDVVDAYILLLKKSNQLKQFNEFDIGTGNQITIKEFCLYFRECFEDYKQINTLLRFGAIPYRKNELMFVEENIQPLFDLGFRPKYDYKKGIETILKEKFYNNTFMEKV
ncbi:NAD(P)-dependent oxidoreductase, partial [Campylobacter jejuni]|nr:NAD(P)-dependent oxidoreductase [Campylobacter jejuni]